MGVVYRPSSSSNRPSQNRQSYRSESSREDSQNVVHGLFVIASIILIGIMVIPLFAVIGFLPAIATGGALIIVIVIAHRVASKAISAHPLWGLIVSGGLLWGIVFAGNATIHAVFPRTLPAVNITNNASIQSNIGQVETVHRSQYAKNSTLIYPYQVGNRFFFHISDRNGARQVEIPQNVFMGLGERLTQNLGGSVNIDLPQRLNERADHVAKFVASKSLIADSGSVLVLDGNVQNVNLQRVFPGKLVLRSVTMDEEMIINHLAELYTAQAITPDNAVIVNGIPSTALELAQSKLSDTDWESWSGIYSTWNKAITRNGFSVRGNTARDALQAFETASNIIVIVAHSDGYSLFFPDGSSFSIDDLSAVQDEIRQNKPLVTLFSCETARIDDGLSSFAKHLIDLGARAVVAPVSTIGARSSSALLDHFLQASMDGLSPVAALQRAIQESNNLSMETWIAMVPGMNRRRAGNEDSGLL